MTADISFIDFDEIENTGNGCIPILLQSTKPSFLKEEAPESSLTNPLNLPSLTSTATTVVGSIENSSLLRRSVRPNKPSSESLLLSSPNMNYPRFNEKKKKNGKKNEQDREEEEGEERKRKKSKISELNTPIKSSASASSSSVISNMETSPSPVLSSSTSILKFKLLPLKDKDGSHSSVPAQHPIDPSNSISLDKKKKINLRGLKLMMPEDVKNTQEVIENISLPKSDNLESESEFKEEANINTSGNPRSKTLSGGAKASTPLKTKTKKTKKKENITTDNNNNIAAITTIDHRSFHNQNLIAPSTPDHFEIISKKPIRSSTSTSTATSLNFSTIPKSSMLTATNAIDLNETVHVHDSISSKTSSSSSTTNKNNIKSSIKSIKLRNFSAAAPTYTSTSTVSSPITSVVSPATLPTVTVPILTPSSTSSSSSRPSRLPSLPAKPEKKNFAKTTEIVNEDICSSCGGLGNFICCDSCPRSFHFTCAEPPLDPQNVPESDWFCSECTFASKNNKKEQEQTSKHKNSAIEPAAPLNQMWEKMITSVTQMNPKCFVMPRRFRYQPKDEDLLKLKNHEFFSSKDKEKEKNNNNINNNNNNNNNNTNTENSGNGRRSIIIDSSKSSSADTMLTEKSDTQPPCPPIVITHTDNTANTIITVNGLQAPNISRFKKPTGYCHCCGLFGVTKSAVNTGTVSTTTTTSTQEEIFELPIESSLNRPLVSCSICPLYWHLDCHDPPLVNYPSQSTSWACPIHFTAERCIALDLFEPLVQSTYLLPESAIKLQFSQKRARIEKEREEAECLRFSPQNQNDPDIETDRDFIYVPEIIKSSYPYQPYI